MDNRKERRFTEKQGQYLAFIYNYSTIHGRPPAEWEMERFFGTTPPTIHQMILKMEERREMTTGRNDPCPCGSGKKYKRCCGNAQQMKTAPPPAGKFRFEPGSYGGPGAAYTPSILCQKQVSETDWRDHFVLANPRSLHPDEASAVAVAEADLSEAFAVKKNGGTEVDLAMSLRSKGYVRVTGFRAIRGEGDAQQDGAGYRR